MEKFFPFFPLSPCSGVLPLKSDCYRWPFGLLATLRERPRYANSLPSLVV
ncbi:MULTISPECIES: hypothetical protein [unclassified Moorena]|nr:MULTISPECIES: hypothetical protein [unclassified Moorena]NEO11035.1 hypothetical protein [Moorena sp. SIO3E8]NEO37833.1 hypothetical protein [Moorena sp. SIOASIH]NEO96680.1 hypothetical protein [Moorena sp. SIO3G5]NEO75182.1 hypothetical protein [Moorena sp. SIO4G3]NEP99149.1 hypothetical protein [Moorena sp. SIO3F7]